MRRIVLLSLTLCLSAVALPAEQGSIRPSSPLGPPAAPPRDTSASPRGSGVATLFGQVLAAETGTPLRGATVTAVPIGGGDGRGPITTRVGADGRYVLHGVAPGEYWLIARHPAYISQSLGQTTPRTPERRVVVSGATRIGPLNFSPLRGTAISGRVLDDAGEPAERVHVRAAKLRRFANQWRLLPAGDAAETDDRGEYRLFGLPPGEYVVGAEPRALQVASGGETDGPAQTGLVRTWAPGTVNPADAQRVRLEPGGEGQVDLQLTTAVVSTIAGRVVDSRGAPVTDGSVSLQTRGAIPGLSAATAFLRDNGRFAIAGVAPGAYTLVVQPRRSNVSDLRTGELPPIEVGVLDVDVLHDSLQDVLVRTTPGATVNGRLIIDGDPAPLAMRSTYVVATPVEPDAPLQQSTRARVEPDLSFELRGVRGRVQVRLAGVPEGWWTRVVRIGAADVTEELDVDSVAPTETSSVTPSTSRRWCLTRRASRWPRDSVLSCAWSFPEMTP